ncbi:hypothetical protein BKA01_002841 [Pseudonocardia eucalypti]|uniref:hypothetical protein n=1 Tax=Pseudonocardia eucalypti TaxID=648755 RepID=UPI0016170325|nr:hypothetical protein [Pseudonocardia eucalypti]
MNDDVISVSGAQSGETDVRSDSDRRRITTEQQRRQILARRRRYDREIEQLEERTIVELHFNALGMCASAHEYPQITCEAPLSQTRIPPPSGRSRYGDAASGRTFGRDGDSATSY